MMISRKQKEEETKEKRTAGPDNSDSPAGDLFGMRGKGAAFYDPDLHQEAQGWVWESWPA
jgi:hypothetical protein